MRQASDRNWRVGTSPSYLSLIIGEDGDVFSDHGDSGKLIVTDDDHRNAIALLWGGRYERLRAGHGQENWTYAIDINKVLRMLNVEIVTGSCSTGDAGGVLP